MNLDIPKFENKRDLFTYLKANKGNIINIKKQAKKFTDNIENFYDELEKLKTKTGGETQAEIGLGYIDKAIVGNTYNWLDSHGDVHVKGCFQKSIGERRTQVMHLHDHELKITSQVGILQDVQEIDVKWKSLGVNVEGNTTALVAQSRVQKEYNPMVYKMYQEGLINQHSVGMFYVKLDLAINSNDSEYMNEKKQWDEVYPLLGNKETAEDQGWFFVVKEAKLLEISAVPYGSNIITPAYDSMTDIIEPEPTSSLGNEIAEPSNDTQIEVSQEVNKTDRTKYFKENFKL